MALIDDAGKIRTFAGGLTIKSVQIFSDKVQQFLFIWSMNQKIIRRNAGLARIDKFAENDSAGSRIQIDILIHNAGVFPP